MASFYENIPQGGSEYAPSQVSTDQVRDWSGTIESDLERELGRHSPLQTVLNQANDDTRGEVSKPLRMALSAIRDTLDRRTREWRGSAKVVEQTLRQLVAAEQARSTALEELADVEADVARTANALTQALAAFDETDETKDIDPLFAQSEAALDDLDRVTGELSIAQHWCRSAWKHYSEALAREQQMRLQIQSAEWAA